MKSKWFGLKEKAISLRRKGFSIRVLENRLGIPRSTLSGWFKNVELTNKQSIKLKKDHENALINARKKAALWHNKQKNNRIEIAKNEALEVISTVDFSDKKILELCLSLLYLGEGYKGQNFGIGSSDPKILKFFIKSVKNLYNIDVKNIKCDLNLRADQNKEKMKKYWSKELNIPFENFRGANCDKRTIGSKTYPSYHGVCQLICQSGLSTQRRLLFIADLYCGKVINQ